MPLFDYMKQTQRFLRDGNQALLSPEDIVSYVNRARREVAMRTQCIRLIPPISGSITQAVVTAGGSGYTNPKVSVTPPDFPGGGAYAPGGAQASAKATVIGGAVNDVQMAQGGYGYFQPSLTITDPTGAGATASPIMTPMNLLLQNQEVYPFSGVPLGNAPGVASIYAVKSVAIIFANYRYVCNYKSFTEYQAYVRNYPFQYQFVPTIWSQYGQGVGGSAYFYPIPSQTYQMEWDCFCVPQDLTDDFSVEAIPQPWTDVVPYFAAHLAYLELQNLNAAKGYLDLYDAMAKRYSAYARMGRPTTMYGRY